MAPLEQPRENEWIGAQARKYAEPPSDVEAPFTSLTMKRSVCRPASVQVPLGLVFDCPRRVEVCRT